MYREMSLQSCCLELFPNDEKVHVSEKRETILWKKSEL
jgi:hypothetical protein